MIHTDDPDVTILLGDAAEQLRSLPDESVHMAVTSPPFYGLRDYGVDGQIGLEETPDEWAARLVEVFREVRRVLRRDGTLWLEVGDSYANTGSGGGSPVDARKPEYGRVGYESDKVIAREPVKAFRKIPDGVKQKDLIGAPWLLAMALRADGWYLRADIIWHRPNPMPESVTDRPTKAHSYVFLLSKSARYFYDADAIREDFQTDPSENYPARARILGRGEQGYPGEQQDKSGGFPPKGSGRNKRSVWTIPTQPLAHDHYAAYPEKLVEPCILAGTSEHGVCSVCGAPWERETEKSIENPGNRSTNGQRDRTDFVRGFDVRREISVTTTGWRPGCDHDAPTIPATVLDPFLGSGTTAIVARRLGRRSIGVELNPKYAALAAGRLSQQSLFA